MNVVLETNTQITTNQNQLNFRWDPTWDSLQPWYRYSLENHHLTGTRLWVMYIPCRLSVPLVPSSYVGLVAILHQYAIIGERSTINDFQELNFFATLKHLIMLNIPLTLYIFSVILLLLLLNFIHTSGLPCGTIYCCRGSHSRDYFLVRLCSPM